MSVPTVAVALASRAVLAAALLATPACSQQAAVPLHRMIGLYRLPDRSPFIVWSRTEGQLAIGYRDAEVRGLSGSGEIRTYGPSLGVFTPEAGSVRFFIGESERADSLLWQPRGGAAVVARRVPLSEREVTFEGDGVQLHGTVIMPEGAGPHSAAVLLHGSGAETREPGRAFAYLFANEGVAALVFDKRGSGRSTAPSFNAPFADLARDAIGGMATLASDPAVNTNRIGLFGPSQGAWVALEATKHSPNIAFLVLQSGDATSPLEQTMYSDEQRLRRLSSDEFSDTEIRALLAFRRLKFMYAITGQGREELDRAIAAARNAPWFRTARGDTLPNIAFWRPNGLYDPIPALEAYRRPVLAVFGGSDTYKDVTRNAELMRAAFARSGNRNATVIVFPGANHGIFETATGLPIERELPKLQRLAPGYVETLTRWLAEHAR